MVTDNIIKLMVWVVCDGTIVDYKKYNPNSKKIRIQWKLSKERKIKRLSALLDDMDIKYTFAKCSMSKLNKLQPYYIRVYGEYARKINEMFNSKKQFNNDILQTISYEQFIVLLHELEITDATRSYRRICWRSTSSYDVDLILSLCNKFNIEYTDRGMIKNHGLGKSMIRDVSIKVEQDDNR